MSMHDASAAQRRPDIIVASHSAVHCLRCTASPHAQLVGGSTEQMWARPTFHGAAVHHDLHLPAAQRGATCSQVGRSCSDSMTCLACALSMSSWERGSGCLCCRNTGVAHAGPVGHPGACHRIVRFRQV